MPSTFAGTPPTIAIGGTSLFTRAQEATTAPLPILTPGSIVTLDAKKQYYEMQREIHYPLIYQVLVKTVNKDFILLKIIRFIYRIF